MLGHHGEHLFDGKNLLVIGGCCPEPPLSLEIFRIKICRHRKKVKYQKSKCKTTRQNPKIRLAKHSIVLSL
jgi:hypothetical protein